MSVYITELGSGRCGLTVPDHDGVEQEIIVTTDILRDLFDELKDIYYDEEDA